MSVFAGPADWWTDGTDAGRTHIATKGIVQSGLVLNLDAGVSSSYDKLENLLRYSEDFSNNLWTKQNGFSITSNTAIAPDGTFTADTASRVNLSLEYLYQNTTAPGTYTLSCWVRAVTGTTTFVMSSYNPTNGTQESGTFTATTTWQRFSHTVTVTTSNSWYPCTPSVSGAQLYIWGAQLEKGSSVTDYYATTSSVKNRGTTLIDLSGLGNNGTLTNGPTYSSSNGGSIVFDGTDDYIDFTSTTQSLGLTSSSGATLSCWLKLTLLSRWTGVFAFWSGAAGTADFGWDVDSSNNLRIWKNGNNSKYQSSSLSAYSNIWSNYVLVSNSTGIIFYINGTQFFTTSAAGNIINGDRTLKFGDHWDSPIQGNTSSISIYNKALTASEISQNFNALRGRFGI